MGNAKMNERQLLMIIMIMIKVPDLPGFKSDLGINKPQHPPSQIHLELQHIVGFPASKLHPLLIDSYLNELITHQLAVTCWDLMKLWYY